MEKWNKIENCDRRIEMLCIVLVVLEKMENECSTLIWHIGVRPSQQTFNKSTRTK